MAKSTMAKTMLPLDRFRWTDEIVTHWARWNPSGVALTDGESRISYGLLDRFINGVAAQFKNAGAGPGDRILILCETSIASTLAVFAAHRMRAWAVPVNARLSVQEVEQIAAHCQPRIVVTTETVSPNAKAHGARYQTEALGLLGDHGGAIGRYPNPGAPEEVTGDPTLDVGALIYTSGTTGSPKGVMVTHDNLVFVGGRASHTRQLTADDKVYAVLPQSHVFGLASVTLGTLYQGATLRVDARFAPDTVAHLLAEEGITIFQGVPQMHAALLAYQARGAKLTAPNLRYISSGGAPLDPGLKQRVEQAFGLPLQNGYGLTETAATVTVTDLGAPVDYISSGVLIPDVEMQFWDATKSAPAALGDVGEVWIRGRLVMRGYYKEPEKTAEAVDADGWYRSGDLGRMDEGGHLHIVGRLKELIIRSGFNVYPPDVEGVLTHHPDIAIAAVLGAPAEDGNEEVVAFLQPRPDADVDIEEMKAFAADRLAPYKRPSRYVVMDTLPASGTGKLLKHKLRGFL